MSTDGSEGRVSATMGIAERIIDFSGRHRLIVLLFAVGLALGGAALSRRTPLDALPDLSDTQVVIATEWMGRNPTLIEDQVTYPLVTAFLGAPKVKLVRGFTMFGMSFVYVVFEDGTDEYWARSRVLEYLSKVRERLPQGVNPQLGPDATSVGWVYQYALVDATGRHTAQELRSYQDWSLRYALQGLEGVAEVATVGGFEKQYQVEIDPVRLVAYGISVGQIASAIRGANDEVGGRVLEMAQHEYAVRGRGYIRDAGDIERAVVTTDARGTPVRIGDVANVTIGPNIRRGVADLDGQGDVVGGIVVMRYGENALDVIGRVKARLAELRSSMPQGVEVVPVYDRSWLIRESVRTLSTNVVQILAIIVVVIGVFLFHARSALVAAVALPIATAASFIAFYALDVTINIMSLAGVILALGDMVDSAVVLVENAHKRIAEAEASGAPSKRSEVVLAAARELGPSMFGALLVLTVSFLPVFALEGAEGRLFRPLALAKTFSMAFASLFAITLVPALMVLLLRGRIVREEANPINRACVAAYRPVLALCLRHHHLVVFAALALALATLVPFSRLGSEFMPPLYEGDLLYMPISVPSMPVEEARRLLARQDALIREVPEVARVFGKAGRAETALDPAPLSMFECNVRLKPQDEWRPGVTIEKLIAELDRKTTLPGLQGAWTMPIKARIDMLATGIRTPVGIKVFGPDLETITRIEDQLERVVRTVRGTRSVYAERELGGFFLDVIPDRDAIARYGLNVRDVLDVVESSIGGMEVTTTIEGRERYTVNVRYPRELRDDVDALKKVLVPVPALATRAVSGALEVSSAGGVAGGLGARDAMVPMGAARAMGGTASGASAARSVAEGMPSDASMGGGMVAGGAMSGAAGSPRAAKRAFVPLGNLARIETVMGPPMIKSEGGQLSGWVYVDLEGRDIGGYVDEAKGVVARDVKLPPGYTIAWTGQYELLERARARMAILLPLTIGLVFAILYFQFKGLTQALIVMAGAPFAAVGAVWLLWALRFDTSVAVWVGMIGLLGVAAETASVMVVYLDDAWSEGRATGRIQTFDDLLAAALEGGSKRVRPLLMTVMTNILGLLPVLVGTGVGADVAKRIAAPMWGGLVSLTLLTLLVIPSMYVMWRGGELRRPSPQWDRAEPRGRRPPRGRPLTAIMGPRPR